MSEETHASLRQRLEVLSVVLDESTDPIFNILPDGTYRYLNRAFSQAFGKDPQELIGRTIYDVFDHDEAEKRMTVVRAALAGGAPIVFEVRVPTPEGDTFYITSVKPIANAQGQWDSVVCISKNITERKREELERERLITALQEALNKVKTLSGLLPICAHCKKIRDDQGYWNQMEAYLQQHADAVFTHGICPDCAHRFFDPEALSGPA